LEVLRSLGKIETVVGSVRVDRLLTTSKTAESVSSSTTVKAEYSSSAYKMKETSEMVVVTSLMHSQEINILHGYFIT